MRFYQTESVASVVADPGRPFDFFAVAICQERVKFTRDA